MDTPRRTIADMQTPRPPAAPPPPESSVAIEVQAALVELRQIIERGGTAQEMAEALKSAAIISLAMDLVGGKNSAASAHRLLELAIRNEAVKEPEPQRIEITRRIVDVAHPT